MCADITTWCQECEVCASHSTGLVTKPPLNPIPVEDPFDRTGVDFIK